MPSPRLAVGISVAASAVVAFGLLGRIDLPLPAALVLVFGARAAAAAASERAAAMELLERIGRSVPAWVAIGAVAMLRAGSPWLADIQGANAVAGLPLVYGAPLIVAASWLALGAGILGLAATIGRPAPVVTEQPVVQAEGAALVLHVLLLVCLFGGPQVRGGLDLVPWVLGIGVVSSATWLARRSLWTWAPRLATVVGFVALVLAVLA